MFRRKAIERMQSPESLDQLLVVVTPKASLTLCALVAILVVVISWSVIARLPVTVDGSGVLLKVRSIKSIQAGSGGLVTNVRVIVGEDIGAGDAIADLDRPEIERELDQLVAKYCALKDFNNQALELTIQKRDLQLELARNTLLGTDEEMATISNMTERINNKMRTLNETQLSELRQTKVMMEKMKQSELDHMNEIEKLVVEGLASDVQRLSALAAVTNTESRIADFKVRIEQAALSQADTERLEVELQRDLERLKNQKQQLVIQQRQAQQDYEYEAHRMRQQEAEFAATIRITKERLFRQSKVISQFKGRILEIGVSVGQMMSAGTRTAIMQLETQEPFHRIIISPDTRAGTFYLVCGSEATKKLPYNATGKQVHDALLELPQFRNGIVQIAASGALPHSHVDLQFSVSSGHPELVHQYDLLMVGIQDAELTAEDGVPSFGLVQKLGDRVPDEELKHLAFFAIGDGKRVAEGMEIRINPANVERQRFGSIVGRVTEVSIYPVTGEGLANLVGDSELASSLLSAGGAIQVEAELLKDPESETGLKWTSKGPDDPVTVGTTTTCRVTVEERQPITYAIPLLRKWLLGEADKEPPPQ